MAPVRYHGETGIFDSRRHEVNEVLVFAGWQLGEDGKLRTADKAATLTEAQERAGRLRKELQRRAVHHDVLQFCEVEFLQRNYFPCRSRGHQECRREDPPQDRAPERRRSPRGRGVRQRSVGTPDARVQFAPDRHGTKRAHRVDEPDEGGIGHVSQPHGACTEDFVGGQRAQRAGSPDAAFDAPPKAG